MDSLSVPELSSSSLLLFPGTSNHQSPSVNIIPSPISNLTTTHNRNRLLHLSAPKLEPFCSPMASSKKPTPQNFHDFLPVMAERLGGEGLIGELCNGFNLLVDGDKGVITFDSLKRNSALLGLNDLSDGDLRSMLREGDFDGDGALNQKEFCVLMFRLSPELMEESEALLEEALEEEFKGFC